MKRITQPRIFEVYLACKAIQMIHEQRSSLEDELCFFEYLQFALDPVFISFNPCEDKDFLTELSDTISYLINYVDDSDWPIDVIDDFDIVQFTLDDMGIERTWKIAGLYS